jgi:hypothetical protein
MNKFSNLTFVVLALAGTLWLGSSAGTNAQKPSCSSQIWISLGGVSKDSMRVQNGKSCYVGTISRFRMKEAIVVERPKFGRITMTTYGLGVWGYISRKDYIGKDSFRIKIVGVMIDNAGNEGAKAEYEQSFSVDVVE